MYICAASGRQERATKKKPKREKERKREREKERKREREKERKRERERELIGPDNHLPVIAPFEKNVLT